MEGKRAGNNFCERDAIDCCDYCGGYFREWDCGDYSCESDAGRRHVKFADIHDYGFQCNGYDGFTNCDGWSAGEFHDCDGDSWRSISGHGDIYRERITDRSERFV